MATFGSLDVSVRGGVVLIASVQVYPGSQSAVAPTKIARVAPGQVYAPGAIPLGSRDRALCAAPGRVRIVREKDKAVR